MGGGRCLNCYRYGVDMDENQLKMLESLKCFLEDESGLIDVEIMELLEDNGINTDVLIVRCNELIKTIKDRRFLYNRGINPEY